MRIISKTLRQRKMYDTFIAYHYLITKDLLCLNDKPQNTQHKIPFVQFNALFRSNSIESM